MASYSNTAAARAHKLSTSDTHLEEKETDGRRLT